MSGRSVRALAAATVAGLAAAASAAAPSDDVQRYLVAAARLYESLEYERALEQLARAKRLSPRADDDVAIALYEGVILMDMGKREEGLAAFRTALLLDPAAKLPVKVSPKVEMDVEVLRLELTRTALRSPPPPPPTTDRPVTTPLVPSPQRPAPAAVPAAAAPGRGPPAVTIALGSVAVASGIGGTVFGVMTAGSLETYRTAPFQDESYRAWEQARRTAPIANGLFIAAGVSAAAAVATLLLIPGR